MPVTKEEFMEQLPDNRAASDEPLYNIGVASRMTGISVATLRAWERRYGYPTSSRTVGGHRLYSERDILRLRWIKSQTERGLQTAQAVSMLRHREDRIAARPVEDAAVPGVAPLLNGSFGDARRGELFEGATTALATSRDRLRATLLLHDLVTADQILGETLLDYSLDELVFEVIQPVLDEIGQGWQEANLTVAAEHLITQYLRHRLFAWLLAGPPLYPVSPIVLACAPGELHEGSLLMLGALLRQRRWPVAYLGQDVPLSDLGKLVREIRPPAVILVAMTEGPAVQLSEWPRYLAETIGDRGPILAYGGRIFSESPDWRNRVPGLFLGTTLREGLERLDRLLHSAAPWLADETPIGTGEPQ